MDKIYRIAKWDEVFVKSENRKLRRVFWISLPIDFESNGYELMLEHFGDEQPRIYGAWCALAAVAGSTPDPGTLVNSKGSPLSLSRIARKSGMPVEVFKKLFDWATMPEVGWLVEANTDFAKQNQCLEDPPGTAPAVPQSPPGSPPSLNKEQGTKYKEQKQITPTTNKQQRTGVGWLVGEMDSFSFGWEEAFSKMTKFNRRCGSYRVDNVTAAAVVLVSQVIDPALEFDLAASLVSGSVKKPRAFARGALKNSLEEYEITPDEAIEAANYRMSKFNQERKRAMKCAS